jgi:hypothetical protein
VQKDQKAKLQEDTEKQVTEEEILAKKVLVLL